MTATSQLTPKQQAIVLYKIIDEMELNIPDAWKKELLLMVKTSGNDKTFNI